MSGSCAWHLAHGSLLGCAWSLPAGHGPDVAADQCLEGVDLAGAAVVASLVQPSDVGPGAGISTTTNGRPSPSGGMRDPSPGYECVTPGAARRGEMTKYRLWWWGTVLAVGVPGATAGLVVSPLPGVFFATTVLGLAIGRRVVAPQAGPWWSDAAVAVVLLCAVGPATGAMTVVLVPLAVVTSPSLVEHGRRTLDARSPQRLVMLATLDLTSKAPDHAGNCLGEADGRALCRMWSASFVRLKSARTAHQRAVAVGLRMSILDELERRDGQGLAAWLARSPCPADEPRWAAASEPVPRQQE